MPYKLLLADDSVTIQRVIELTFADEDVQVIAVSDGDQAIAQLDAHPPDIVLADVGMPGRDGYQVAEHVKQSPRLSHIPVVLLTGAFEPVDEVRANSIGCDGVLAKPFEPQLVISRVKELLVRPGRAAAALDANLAPPSSSTAETWAPQIADAPIHPEPATPRAASPSEYFDRLDAAFASLSSGGAAESRGTPASKRLTDSIDWFESTSSGPGAPAPPDLPLSYASSQEAFNRASAPPSSPRMQPVQPRVATTAPAAPPATSAPEREGSRPTLPPLADAFAALLAAEQHTTPTPTWPAAAASAPVVTDDLIEQVTRRVLERLSDRVVRETVASIAERLVREEIERIKASIK